VRDGPRLVDRELRFDDLPRSRTAERWGDRQPDGQVPEVEQARRDHGGGETAVGLQDRRPGDLGGAGERGCREDNRRESPQARVAGDDAVGDGEEEHGPGQRRDRARARRERDE
jgi:hypothetical protein